MPLPCDAGEAGTSVTRIGLGGVPCEVGRRLHTAPAVELAAIKVCLMHAEQVVRRDNLLPCVVGLTADGDTVSHLIPAVAATDTLDVKRLADTEKMVAVRAVELCRRTVKVLSAVVILKLSQGHLVRGKLTHIQMTGIAQCLQGGVGMLTRRLVQRLCRAVLGLTDGDNRRVARLRLVDLHIGILDRIIHPFQFSSVSGRCRCPRRECWRVVTTDIRHGDVVGGAKCDLQRLAAGHSTDHR